MAIENEDYKLEILEYAVNQSINRLLPKKYEDALNVILGRSNEIVWKVVTDIYTNSGHQIDFVFIKDILNSRIEPLKKKIAEEGKIKKAKEAGEAKIRAKLKAKKLEKTAEQQRIKQEQEAEKEKLRKLRENARQENFKAFREKYPNISLEVFLKIENLITEELLLDEEQIVTMDSILSQDLGADNLYIMELTQAIEKEFDIEIPEYFTGTNWISCICDNFSRLESITVKEIVDIVCKKIQ